MKKSIFKFRWTGKLEFFMSLNEAVALFLYSTSYLFRCFDPDPSTRLAADSLQSTPFIAM